MRVLALLVVAGCGRIAFDPVGEADGGGGATTGDGGDIGDGSGAPDATLLTCSSSYDSGSNTFINGTTSTASINVPANAMANTLIVVQIHWASNTGNVSTVTDTNGNSYALAANISAIQNVAQKMYTAPYRVGGAGTLTVTFTAAVPNPDITFATFTNVDTSSPAAVPVGGGGTSAAPSTMQTNVTAPATLVAALASGASGATAGSGFQKRVSNSGSFIADRCAGASGAYNATAALTTSTSWVLQLIALRSL